MVLRSVSNMSIWNFHYNLFSRTLQTMKYLQNMRHTKVPKVKISNVGSLYFLRYVMWKLGFMNGPEISFKQVSFAFSL
jgi:hypothetical protein